MKTPGPPLPQRHLQPGEVLVTQEPQWVVTLLGSCVAVTMFSARFNLAAICHAMLPEPHGKDLAQTNSKHSLRYLSRAIPALAERFAQIGLKPEEVEVKMFGGGNVIHMGGDPQGNHWIGSANVTLARELLQATGFRIKAQNVGGQRGCKIMFNTQTGQVLHRHLSRGAVATKK
jgi:chemotaxis protein CheD